MTNWDKQEAEAERREAIQEAAADAAATHFASPEALAKVLELVGLEDEDVRLEAQALCTMWHATQTAESAQAVVFMAEALEALRKFTEAVFARITVYELEFGELK